MGIANSSVFFSAETSLGIGILHTSTGYNIRITVTVHIHHCHLILRTAACIVKGNSQSSALAHLALALGNQRNGCCTGSLEAITSQTSHIHLIIQRIGNDHILFCQSGSYRLQQLSGRFPDAVRPSGRATFGLCLSV